MRNKIPIIATLLITIVMTVIALYGLNSTSKTPSAITGKSLNDWPVFVFEPQTAVLTAKTVETPPSTVEAPVAPAVPSSSGGDAKLFIYNHESGNNPTRANGSGCLGLGQACPGSKLLAVCPNLDYACEDVFFTNYMLARYKSWDNAKAFWLAHNWW